MSYIFRVSGICFVLACGAEPAGTTDESTGGPPAGTSLEGSSGAGPTGTGSSGDSAGGPTEPTTSAGASETGSSTGGVDPGTGSSESSSEASSEGVDSDPAGPSFTEVFEAIFLEHGCTSGYCHGGGAGGLDMTDEATTYANMVDVAATTAVCGLSVRVVPGAPEESVLWVRSRPAALDDEPCAPKMPQGSTGLPDAEAALLNAWIAGGALE